jgi:hypothetical protein
LRCGEPVSGVWRDEPYVGYVHALPIVRPEEVTNVQFSRTSRCGTLVALLVTVAVQGWAQDSAMTQSLERRIPALMEAADR